MRQHRNMWGKAGLALLVLLLAATALSAQTKVRVKDPAAVIRIEPAANGEIVQDKVAVGTEFTVERKTGDWYEIKYRSAIGVLLSGFIHQSQVEEIKTEAPVQKTEPEPVNKPVTREESPAPQSGPGLEISLFGGFGLTSVKGAATYGDSWSYAWLANVTESTAIASTSKNAPFFGGGLNYFFTPNFGFGLNVGYLKSTIDTTSHFAFSWTWSSAVGGGTYNKSADWANATDSLSSIPVSLNIVGRFGSGLIQGFFEAGPTIYFNEAIINSAIGYGISYYSWPSQWVDAIELPMSGFDSKSGKSSWTGIGANVGAGITFMFSPSFGLSLEARYFFCPEREFDWAIAAGSYNGMFFGDLTNWTMTAADLQHIFDDNLLTTIKINPSFFELQAGVKIKL